jgi:hypothetical protein
MAALSIAESHAPGAHTRDPRLRLYILFTNSAATRKALQAANELAREIGACLALVLPQIVPYPLPLESPPVSAEFSGRALAELLEGIEAETSASVCLCRDRNEAVRAILPPDSVVLMGVSRPRWWANRERSLIRLLRRDGHHTLLIEANRYQTAEVGTAELESTR